jgi:hypothetical protein
MLNIMVRDIFALSLEYF